MKILKIKNLVQPSGKYDYKNLDIDLFISGSQLYFDENINNAYCYVKTMGDNISTHEDIIEVSEEEYNEAKQTKDGERKQQEQQKQSVEERLQTLENAYLSDKGVI